ncbi:MobF family relaxase [Sphingomonas oryzagri]|uniref:MobF family relaxase n=1 Tax=Sphingomonas oryzagri TaxID=3042314 RepID=A0ABT6N1N8_9SPHN|nr:MobF family relaxase [Sphingomonas oryzagri]MDH7639204.1 MobF family relaxase [Sphingomonas oryzagri]
MIHPRRLSGSAGNIARYYSVGDYYTKGGDEPSAWGGGIARDMGLEGKPVDPKLFQQLLAGEVHGQQLGRHRSDGTIQHHPGWDFAVNAPKSVSIMALVAGDDRVIAAHEKAVDVAVGYLEEHAALRRRDSGEIVHETTGRLIFARFQEHASRELDPHLHTHVVVMNMTNGAAHGPMASLETRAMYVEQMTAGQVYRNELASGLKTLGYDISADPRSGRFEITGVPAALIEEMSQRRRQIDEHAREHGLEGQAARRRSFYETRGPKERAGLDDLRRDWTNRAAAHRAELDLARMRAETGQTRPLEVDPAVAARAMLFGVRHSEEREAVNNKGQLLRSALASHVGEIRLEQVRPLIEGLEQRRQLLATREPTGDQLLIQGRTTRRTARLELRLVDQLALALDDAAPIASRDRLLVTLEDAGLAPAQEQALVDLATSRDRVNGLHGVAGAGKSTMVKALAEAAEPGTKMVALAPTSSAASNLGQVAGIESRTVASLLAGGGRGVGRDHVLVVDEAGQLGSRQAERLLEISRTSGARLLLIGDNKQTGAIEQGKAFWLLQRLGMPTAQLTESVRQETRAMKAAVAQARVGNYADAIGALDKVVSGEGAEALAGNLVREWTRLKPDNRAATNILVLDNSTRRLVNERVREVLQREGVVAAEDTRLQILSSAAMTEQEKRLARFYSGGQVVTFGRDIAGAGIARDIEYRVVGTARVAGGRQIFRLIDAQGREVRWDPRVGRASQVNVFQEEARDLSAGDRIQWRLVNRDLDLRNAERGTVEQIEGTVAMIRWDKGERRQEIDLGRHRTWDHGYAETVYSAQSKTYDRVYVLAPVASPLVNGQNFYTAITRARFGVKLWTEDPARLVDRLERRSGEKSSATEGLGRLSRDHVDGRQVRHGERLRSLREEMDQERRDRATSRPSPQTVSSRLATRASEIGEALDRLLARALSRGRVDRDTSRGVDR